MKPKFATVTVHGCTVQGATVTAAKATAQRLLDANHDGDYTPYTCTFRHLIGLVWREPLTYVPPSGTLQESWWYRIMDTAEGETVWRGAANTNPVPGSKVEAIAILRYYMAMRAWDMTPEDIEACAEFCTWETKERRSPDWFRSYASQTLACIAERTATA